MKPRNREVNIFNMSVLDLLTGALGAFCFLTLALFPSYYQAQHASADASANPAKRQQLEAERQQLEAELADVKTGTGLAPFALVAIYTADASRTNQCAQIRVKKEKAPGALSSLKVFPTTEVQDGYFSRAMLFMFEPGSYQMSFAVSGVQPGCTMYLTPMGKNATPQQSIALPNGLQLLPWTYDVKPDQLATGTPLRG